MGISIRLSLWIFFIPWLTLFARGGSHTWDINPLDSSLATGIILGITSGQLSGFLAPSPGIITGALIQCSYCLFAHGLHEYSPFALQWEIIVGWSVFMGSGNDLTAMLICVLAGFFLSLLSVTGPGRLSGGMNDEEPNRHLRNSGRDNPMSSDKAEWSVLSLF